MRWRLARAGMVAAMASLLAGCGASAYGPVPALHQPTTAKQLPERRVDARRVRGSVELMVWQSDPVESRLLRETIGEFERLHPRIDVRVYAYTGDYPSGVLTRFTGENPPDVLAVDAAYAPDWIARGMLLPLDGYLRGNGVDAAAFHEVLLDGFRGRDAHLYGIPKDYSTLALFVNRRMLGDAGIPRAPRTWRELEAAARRMTNDDHHGICLPASWDRLTLFALQAGGGFVDASGARMLVGSDETRRGIDFYMSLLRRGSGTTPAAAGTSWCGDAFGKEQVAMAIEGNWLVPPMRSSFPHVEYDVVPVPAGARQATLAYAPAYSIARSSSQPDAAWVLVSWLTSRDGMRRWTDRGLALPSRTDLAAPPGSEAFAAGLEHARLMQLPPGFATKVYMTAENELTAVLEGEQSVDGMVDRIDGEGSSLLAGGAAR